MYIANMEDGDKNNMAMLKMENIMGYKVNVEVLEGLNY